MIRLLLTLCLLLGCGTAHAQQAGTYNALVVDADLIARWTGDGNNDTTGDGIESINPGVSDLSWSSSASYGTGPWGTKSFAFNGSNHLTASVSGISYPLSMVCWNKISSTAANFREPFSVGQSGGRFWMYQAVSFNTSIELFQYTGSFTSTSEYTASGFTPGQWELVVVTIDEGDQKLYYKDNAAVTSSRTSLGNASLFDTVILGKRFNNTNAYWRDELALPAIYGRVLTSAEVLSLHAGPEPLNTTAPTIQVSGGGAPTPGVTLTTDDASTWDDRSNGTGTTTYQWFADDEPIEGETAESLDTTGLSVGVELKRRDRRSNDGGSDSDEDALSNGITLTSGGEDSNVPAASIIYRRRR